MTTATERLLEIENAIKIMNSGGIKEAVTMCDWKDCQEDVKIKEDAHYYSGGNVIHKYHVNPKEAKK